MARQAIFQFSPGDCARVCPCSYCPGTTPRYIDVELFGETYTLGKKHDLQEQECVWAKIFPEGSRPTIDCGEAAEIWLVFSETALGDVYAILTVADVDGVILHSYNNIGDDEVVCADGTLSLPKVGGSCGGTDEAVLTAESASGNCCGNCGDEGSSGSGSGGGGDPPPVDESCACCGVLSPTEWELNIPGPMWSNPTPNSFRTCTNCGVSGMFVAEYWTDCKWRYISPKWCEDHPFCEALGDIQLIIIISAGPEDAGDPDSRCVVHAVVALEHSSSHGLCSAPGDSAHASYTSDPDDVGCDLIPLYLDAIHFGGRQCDGQENGAPDPPAIIYATPIP